MFQESSTPIEAEIPPSQNSTNQEESVERMDEDSTPKESCAKTDEKSTQDQEETCDKAEEALNTSEVRLVPECDEDDDVVIPMPDDDSHRYRCNTV